MPESPTTFPLEVRPTLPDRLSRLEELAGNLYYSWDRRVSGLFKRLDLGLWRASSNNPDVFLRRVKQSTLHAPSEDPDFFEEYELALAVYDAYLRRQGYTSGKSLDPETDLVACFCF